MSQFPNDSEETAAQQRREAMETRPQDRYAGRGKFQFCPRCGSRDEKETEMNRDKPSTMSRAAAITALTEEANWPPMNPITAALWQHLTPEQRYAWMTAPRQECDEPRADGRHEHPSSIPAHYRKYWGKRGRR